MGITIYKNLQDLFLLLFLSAFSLLQDTYNAKFNEKSKNHWHFGMNQVLSAAESDEPKLNYIPYIFAIII